MGLASSISSVETPDSIRTQDVFVKDEQGNLKRFEGSDTEFVEAFYDYEIANPSRKSSFLRPHNTRFDHNSYQRKPSFAILSYYAACVLKQFRQKEKTNKKSKKGITHSKNLI